MVYSNLPHGSSRTTCRFSWRVLQVAVPGHVYSARDEITLKITVWLPGPRAAEAHVPQSQRVIGDSSLNASAFGGKLSTPLMNAPMEIDTVGFSFPTAIPRDHQCKRRRSTRRIAMCVGNVVMYHYLWNQPPPPGLISRRKSLHAASIRTTSH